MKELFLFWGATLAPLFWRNLALATTTAVAFIFSPAMAQGADNLNRIYLSDIAEGDGGMGFTISGEEVGDRLGIDLSTGDVNGDGQLDVCVTADANDEAGTNAGAAYIIFGANKWQNPIDLVDLSDRGVKLLGELPEDGVERVLRVIHGAYYLLVVFHFWTP